MSGSYWFIIAVYFIILQQISAQTMPRKGENVTLDSDGCQVRRRFFNQKNIAILTRRILLGFTINCTTQTLYKAGYSNGVSCPCGEYLTNQNNKIVFCPTTILLQVNFTVEISVENVGNPGGERCTFSFIPAGVSIKFDVRILPHNVSTSVQPLPTRSEVLTSSTTHESPTDIRDRRDCTKHAPSLVNATLRDPFNQTFRLERFDIKCSTITIFKITYTNGPLCDCGTVEKPDTILNRKCQSRLHFDINLQLSFKEVRPVGENCSLSLKYVRRRNPLETSIVSFWAKFSLDGVMTESFVVSNLVTRTSTRVITSYITSTIGPSSATSSLLASKSELRNSMMTSTQMSSSMMIPQPSQSVIPFFTGIIITPTPSILQSTVPSIQQSSVLATNTSTFIQTTPTTSEVLPSSTLSPEMEKLKEDIKFINNVNTSEIRINDTKSIKEVLDAAANLLNQNQTSEEQKEDPGMKAVEVLEDLGNVISQQLELGNESVVTFELAADDLVFGAAVINTTVSPEFSFPSGKSSIDERIDIPSSVFVSESGKSFFVGIIFKAYREMRNNTGNLTMGTKVINAIVTPLPSKSLEDPVEMTFEKTIIGITSAPACSFYLENSSHSGQHGRWSTMGCKKLKENQTHIQCNCSHLTNFAVLFKISDDQEISEEDTFRLVVITYIGLSLSILGCLLTFIIYVSLSSIKSDRATIHTNLVLTLGIADVIFLVTVAVQPEGDSCIALAMLAFYFYLGVFFWMLNEGVYIYLMVIKVFRGNVTRRRRVAYLVGWGCPFIIAIITWAVLRDDVISEYHCWLSVKTGAIWAFVGPGLAIILFNIVILLAVMRTTWATFVDDKEYGGLKSATKTFGAVIPILGITWVFGVMAFNESSIVFQYIFAIANSIQGALIFILYCIVNNEVRSELLRKFEVWQTRREVSSSTGGGRRTTYPYIVSSEENTTFNRTTTLSAQATPDFNRVPLADIKDAKSSGRVEKRYSFDNINVTPGKDSDLSVPEDDADREEVEDSGRSSPIKLGKEVGNNDVGDDSVGHV